MLQQVLLNINLQLHLNSDFLFLYKLFYINLNKGNYQGMKGISSFQTPDT